MGDYTPDVTAEDFQTEVLGAEKPVLVDFWAEWCGPCKMIAPVVEDIAQEHADKISVRKLDADAHPSVLQQYGIMGIPTLILFSGGEPVVRITGFHPKDKIVNRIQDYL